MRSVIFGLVLCLCTLGFTQDKSYVSYFTTLNYGDTFTQGELQVVFVKLVNDSRCPKSVSCIRAGEAIIEVDIYIRGEFVETRELVFPAEGTLSEKNNLMFNNDDIRLVGIALNPYPEAPGQLSESDYSLEIKIN
ncbi:MAG: hypothetical protein HKO90_03355 [Flavobacteriaceae bacterium]|nr:hypothetical protein [Flavobacteriaceae bacterium]